MNTHAVSRRLSLFLNKVLCTRQMQSGLAVVLLGLGAVAGRAQTMTVVSGPPTTLSSGANPGVITVAEENSGSGTFSFATGATGISLTISASGYITTATQYSTATYTTTTGLALITLTNGGSGYSSANPPTVTISAPGGSGTTATASPVVSTTAGMVVGLTITNAGSGYTSPPTISFTCTTPCTGSGATAAAVLSLYNGIATFDLTQVPLYALGSGTAPNTPQATNYTFTYTDTTNTSITASSPVVQVTVPTALYIVDSFNNDSSSYTCTAQPVQNSGNNYTVLPTLDTGAATTNFCNLRTALTKVDSANLTTSSTSATIAFNPTQTTTGTGLNPTTAGTAGSWPQIISLGSSMQTATWLTTLTMTGPGPSRLFINGGANYPIFEETSANTGTFNLSGMTLENAKDPTINGAALNLWETTNISNVNFLNNAETIYSGGAIYINGGEVGTVTISNCMFEGNYATTGNGGAISNASFTGNLTINGSSFIGNYTNSSTGAGGAISWVPGTANTTTTSTITITNSLFASNSSITAGGALNLNENGGTTKPASVILTNDTFYLNSVGGTTGTSYGGAIYLNGNNTNGDRLAAVLNNVTIVGNEVTYSSASGGGLYTASGSNATINNSIIEGNTLTTSSTGTADAGCVNACTFQGNNIYSTTGQANAHTGSYTYPGLTGLVLSDLGSYGGPTQTLVPLPGSPALKNSSYVSGGSNPGTDQRGFPRPTTGTNTIDTGAVQTNPSVKFVAQPGANQTTGTTFSPVPTAQYLDSGYVITDSASPLAFTASLTNGTLSAGSTASSTMTATFSGIQSTTPETSTQLKATVGAGTSANPYVSATSSSFEILGAASQLAFGTVPTASISAGSSSGNVVVDIEDSAGNLETGSSATVYLEITSSNGYAGYGTAGNVSVSASGGVATFSGLPALTIPGTYIYTVSTASNFATPNNTATETVTINSTALTLSVTPSTTEPYGTEVKLTGTLSPYSQGTATTNAGTVTFLNNGTSIGTGTLASGVATLSIASLSVGSNSLTASYAGNTSFAASTSSAMSETSTPPPFAAIKTGTPVTVTLTFSSNFTMGSTSPSLATSGTANSPFAITGGTCAANTAYGPATTSSCTVTVTYTPGSSTGGGFITGTVQAFDSNAVLQGASNVTVSRYR